MDQAYPPHSRYRPSLALLTDLYQVTMAYAYWKSGMKDTEAAFHLSFRRQPFQGGFSVACGLADVIEFLENFHFEPSDLAYLAQITGEDKRPLFPEAFMKYLGDLRFTCDVDAVPEGTVVFSQEPLLRVVGPIIQAQLVETALLTLINFQTLIATKAARVCLAAEGNPVIEFGLRRAQGIDGGLSASRAAYLGGCSGTSNLLAGKLYDIPVKGTHAHSWVMAFENEREAFQKYAEAMPNNCVFLVDTYDTIQGVKHAVEVGRWLRSQGHELVGVRLDSGDLAYLSLEARRILDESGFPNARIFATNDLNEHVIGSLKQQRAAITVWGVGTQLVTAHDDPALGGVYKLSAVRTPGGAWEHRLKLSEQAIKISTPGIQQVRRFEIGGEYAGDAIFDLEQGISDSPTIIDPLDPTRSKSLPKEARSQDLLQPIFRGGKKTYELPSIHDSRKRVTAQLNRFHPGIKRILNPHTYPVGLEANLHQLKTDLTRKARRHHTHRALILVDLQNDFLPGGALGVTDGDSVVPIANEMMALFPLVIASQDWHPKNHGSFASNHPGKEVGEQIELSGIEQILWPNHCVQNTEGAQLVKELTQDRITRIFQKGTDPSVDSYSVFYDNARLRDTGLGAYLRSKGVSEVYLMGLATDYCVKFSAIDSISLGFKTTIIEDGCRAVNLSPGDHRKAIEEMKRAGARVVHSLDVSKLVSYEHKQA